jgi:transposase-like protein
MCPYTYYSIMRKSKDKRQIRYQMIISVRENGIKQTARDFRARRNTVRKWWRRWLKYGYKGLEELSRKPHNSPNATPPEQRKELVKLKKKYKRIGADTIKVIENIPISSKTIRKIWRQEEIPSRKRPKKHATKQNLREVKKEWALFQQIDEDTKDLVDIPEYWPQMMKKRLPKVQYSARDVTSGLSYFGFADERSLTYSTLFAEYLNYLLQKNGVDLSKTVRQTDNGSEYVGSWQSKEPSAYTKAVESVPGQIHITIFPGAHRFQADIETLHNLVEMEFYEVEKFRNRRDFLNKAYSYQLFFNLLRPNSYKENKTPWQLAKEKNPDLSIEVAKIPPVFLDDLMDKIQMHKQVELLPQGGYDVYSVPSFCLVYGKLDACHCEHIRFSPNLFLISARAASSGVPHTGQVPPACILSSQSGCRHRLLIGQLGSL